MHSILHFRQSLEALSTTLDEVQKSQVEPQLREVNDRINELSGSQCLSVQRKENLIKRIEALFLNIPKSLSPIHMKNSEIIRADCERLKNLRSQIGYLSTKEVKHRCKELSPAIFSKILHLVWLYSGAPRKEGFARALLECGDFRIFYQQFMPILGEGSGAILDQTLFFFEEEHKISALEEDMRPLEALESLLNNLGTSDDELARAFCQLSSEVKDQLVFENLRFSLDVVVAVKEEKRAEGAALKLNRDNRMLMHFERLLQDPLLNQRQLQLFYEMLSSSAQNRLIPSQRPPYFGHGVNTELHKSLGAHYNFATCQTVFRFLAPHASEVVLHLTFDERIEHHIPLTRDERGIWSTETSFAGLGRTYYYHVTGPERGRPFKKLDPFAMNNLIRSEREGDVNHESVVCVRDADIEWTDILHMEYVKRTEKSPATIYKVHVSSYKKKSNGLFLNFKELAPELVRECRENYWTVIELIGVFEHPRQNSSECAVSSFFVLNSRMGSYQDFQFFVNHLHNNGIRVILEWYPSCFAQDPFSLSLLDGTAFCESEFSEKGEMRFDFDKPFARDFLLSHAFYLFEKFHIDGICAHVEEGCDTSGKVNLCTLDFFRELNVLVHRQFPGRWMISSQTRGTEELGFDFAWNDNFSDQMVKFMEMDPLRRNHHHDLLVDCVFTPQELRGKSIVGILPEGENSIHRLMLENDFDRFANGRLLQAFHMFRGGGPLLEFMGNEMLQNEKWQERRQRNVSSIHWEALDANYGCRLYQGAKDSRKELNRLFLEKEGLHDQTNAGWGWITHSDSTNNVISFYRRGERQQFVGIFNFSNRDLFDYDVLIIHHREAHRGLKSLKLTYHSDAQIFGGMGRVPNKVKIERDGNDNPIHFNLRLPPYSAIILEEEF